MRTLAFYFLLFSVLAFKQSFAQNGTDSLPAADNRLIPLPTVSVNVGFNHGFTDVALSSDGPTPFRQLGYQLTITQRVAKFLNAGFELYTGSILGEEQRGTANLNFRTSLVSPRINLEYNFYPLLKPDSRGRQLIRPYLGFGIGMVIFRSKGDLKDGNGNAYQYWSNGSIYAEAEGTVPESEATPLERDFEYESDLRDANLDGFRKYSQTAFSMPVNAGIRFQLSKNVGINAAFAYVLNFTDLIDNVSAESVGVRQGAVGFDNHLYGSIGLSVFLGTTRPSVKPQPRFDQDLSQHEQTEKDSTGSENDSPQTEAGSVASEDSMGSGVEETAGSAEATEDPSSLEESPSPGNEENQHEENWADESQPENAADTDGAAIGTEVSQDGMGDENRDDSTARPATPELNIGNIAETRPKQTGDYHWADLNEDDWISPDEVLHFIDLLFEGEAVRDVKDIQNLIDYYFDQE